MKLLTITLAALFVGSATFVATELSSNQPPTSMEVLEEEIAAQVDSHLREVLAKLQASS